LSFVAILLTGHYIGAILALTWCGLSRTPWESIGLRRPTHWLRTVVTGVLFGVALKLAIKALVFPLLGLPATNAGYAFLLGNQPALPGMLFTVVVGGGIGEELQWRGFLFERLGTWLKVARGSTILILLISAMLFALAHLPDQGIPGAVQALLTGLSFGILYRRSGSLGLPMVAHAAFDVTAVILIYRGWEIPVAHAIFR
jgi:membrane protease YdiL (CAAX protease family)